MKHARFISTCKEGDRWVENLPANEHWQVWSIGERKKLAEFSKQADAWTYIQRERQVAGPMFLLSPKP